jgi:hypothetical protein
VRDPGLIVDPYPHASRCEGLDAARSPAKARSYPRSPGHQRHAPWP